MTSSQLDHMADWLEILSQSSATAHGGSPGSGETGSSPLSQRIDRASTCLALLDRVWAGETHLANRRAESGIGLDEESEPFPALDHPFLRFRILNEAGRGGHGIVYRAHDRLLERDVAIKLPHLATLVSPDLHRRFLREAQALSRLSHPNIVPVYETGNVGPAIYIVSAYCAGPTLHAWLKNQSQPVDPYVAASVVHSLAKTLAYVHQQGILHRDLKPANVLLEPVSATDALPAATSGRNAFGFLLKLTDFGIARLPWADSDETRSGAVLGTPKYMAPEQASGRNHEIGKPADVYALGAILAEMLAGCLGDAEVQNNGNDRAGAHPSVRTLKSAPEPLQYICHRCLAFHPADRYQSADLLAADLERFLAGKRLVSRRNRFRNWGWRLGAACLVLALVIAMKTVGPRRDRGTAIAARSVAGTNIVAPTTTSKLISLLEEDWEQQQLGDDSAALLHWRGPAARGLDDPSVHTIVAINGSKVLHINASKCKSGKPYLGSVPEKPYLPFFAGEMLSAVFDARLDDAMAGVLTFSIVHFPTGTGYLLNINDQRKLVELLKRDAELDDGALGTTGENQFDPDSGFHRYELRAMLRDGTISFQVGVDGKLLFVCTDPNPIFTMIRPARFQFQVFPRPGQGRPGKEVFIDNVRVLGGAAADFPQLRQ